MLAYGNRHAAPVRSGMANTKAKGPDMGIPKKVQDNAKKGLELRREHGFGGTQVGEKTAQVLAKGGDVTERKARHIAKYWPRHEHDNLDQKGQKGEKPSKGYIAWLLWGGDEGRTWSEGLVEKLDAGKSDA